MKNVERLFPRITVPSRAKSTYIEPDLDTVRKTLAELRSSKLAADSDFGSVNQLLTGLGSIGLTTGTLQPGAYVMRTRCEATTAHQATMAITQESHLSYRPDYQHVGIGRANLACEPVFYGCLVQHDGKRDDVFAKASSVCFKETHQESLMQQTVIAGIWRVIKPMSFTIVVQQAGLMKANQVIRQSLLPKHRFFRGDHRETEASRLVADFFAELYSRPVAPGEEHKYVVGACFATSLFLQGIDSLVYSSIAADGAMANIAILPEVVDESLRLVMVRAAAMHRISPTDFIEGNAYAATPNDNRWFKKEEAFQWHPHTDTIGIRKLRA